MSLDAVLKGDGKAGNLESLAGSFGGAHRGRLTFYPIVLANKIHDNNITTPPLALIGDCEGDFGRRIQ